MAIITRPVINNRSLNVSRIRFIKPILIVRSEQIFSICRFDERGCASARPSVLPT
jgi:hypothetical protein